MDAKSLVSDHATSIVINIELTKWNIFLELKRKKNLSIRNDWKISGTPYMTLCIHYFQVLSWILKKHGWQQLTTFIKDVIFHRAYTRARPADRLGPWLNKALIPAGKGNIRPRGRTNRTKRKSNSEIEYICSKVSRTKLKSPSSSIERTKPTRSCKNER